MTSEQFFFLIPYGLSFLISLGVGIIALHRMSFRGAKLFAVLVFLEAEWVLTYILQVVSQDLQMKLFWNNAQFLGAVYAPMCFLFFARQFEGGFKKFDLKFLILNGVVSSLILGLIWTDSFHHLFRLSSEILTLSPFPRLVFIPGRIFPIFSIYAYSLLIFGVHFFLKNFDSGFKITRLQISVILFFFMIPWISSLLSYLGFIKIDLHDLAPLSFGFSNLIAFWALNRFLLFEIVPLSRNILVENMQEGILVVDLQLRILDFNPAFEKIINQSLSGSVGKEALSILPELKQVFKKNKQADDSQNFEIMDFSYKEKYYEIRLAPLAVSLNSVSGYLFIFTDITVRKEAEKALQHLAVTDPLTGLFNRRHFLNIAERELQLSRRHSKPIAFLMLDLDRYKFFNDTYGHAAGDLLMKSIVAVCLQNLRATDVFCRYGGDEFYIMLPETNQEQACNLAERLHEAVRKTPVKLGETEVKMTLSIGVSALNGSEQNISLNDLLERADTAMYKAKQSGRDRIWLYTD